MRRRGSAAWLVCVTLALGLGGCKRGKTAGARRTVSAAWKPGTALAYVLYKGKVEAGISWGRYVGPVKRGSETLHRFETRVRIDPGKLGISRMAQITQEAVLETDDRGHPRRFRLRTGMGRSLDLTIGGGSLRGKAGTRTVQARVADNTFLLANNHVFHEVLLLSLVQPTAPKTTVAVLSANALRTLEVTYAKSGSGAAAVLESSLGEKVHLRDGRVSSIVVELQGVRFVREKRPPPKSFVQRPPPRYRRPAGATWTDQEVRVKAQGTTLAGTLSVPRSGPARKPAVLFISGSGSQDRHGFSAGVDIGTWEILDRLAGAGFVVLRMDDRGAGASPSGRVPGGIGYHTLVGDSRRALAFLSARPEVDPRNLFLIGHSEGALTAAILAAEKIPVRAVVLMAGPARSVVEVMRAQNEALVWRNLPPKQKAKQRRIFDEIVAAVKERRRPNPQLVPSALWEQQRGMVKWFSDHLALPVPRTLRAISQPVLIAQGGKDFQVSVDRDAKVAARLIRAAGNKDVTLKVFPNLDHLFKPEPGTSSLQSYLDRSRRVSPAFLDLLTRWLRARVKK